MSTEKETSEEDKVTQASGEILQAEGSESESVPTPETDHPESEHEEHEEKDYSHFSKSQLLQSLRELLGSANIFQVENDINSIKSHFDELLHKEKEEALSAFTQNGGSADDFEYRLPEVDRSLLAGINEFREKKSAFLREQEKQKERNLLAKNMILDKLRELVDGEETTSSISTIKQIQEEWKKIGPVPTVHNKNLWASYNALMDRFYDNRSIYFELKELDRKKNLEQKNEICDKAEALIQLEDLKEAIKQLNDLHEEFKHIGPVPRDEQEALWTKFKTASDSVYARRKEYYEGQKEVLKENLGQKEDLIKKLQEFGEYKGSRIKDWNIKTKEILDIQKQWEKVGPVPRENGREINKHFWGLFKQFFHNKNHFFKELDEIRTANKNLAEELIQKAEGLMNLTDWQTTANQMIALQQEWKKIGPTPEKVRDDLFGRFKNACDTFFENRRNSTKQVNKEFENNLKAKEDLVQQIQKDADGSDLSESVLKDYIQQYNAIGFVPRKNMKEILGKFNEAVDAYVKKLGIGGGDKEDFLFRVNLNKLQSEPNSNRVLNKKEHGIRKQIADLENNITLWRNNLEYFASSKTADKLKDQFDERIQKAETEIEKLKKKLSIIREF